MAGATIRTPIRDCHTTLALVAIAAAAGAGALLAAAGARLVVVPAPRDALAATPGTALELLRHNLPVALWPLALVALGWPAMTGVRRVGDALVLAQLAGHGALIGSALAQHGELWRYLPHLPLECLAIAVPAAAWRQARTGTPDTATQLARVGAAVAALLAVAALIETYLVPLP
jgi:hypothetical protein